MSLAPAASGAPQTLSPAAVAAPTPSASGGARIAFDRTTYDFGAVMSGDAAQYGFVFHNTGNEKLIIGKVTTGCGCTAALVTDKEIPPGGQGLVKATFNSRGYKGKVHKTVYVETNDPTHPRVTLALSGEVKVDIEATPPIVYVTAIGIGESATRTLTVSSPGGSDFHVTKVSATPAEVRVGEAKQVADHKYEIKVTIKPERGPGSLSGLVTIETDSKRQPKLYVSVMANVRKPE